MANWLNVIYLLLTLLKGAVDAINSRQRLARSEQIKADPRASVHEHFGGLRIEPPSEQLPGSSATDNPDRPKSRPDS